MENPTSEYFAETGFSELKDSLYEKPDDNRDDSREKRNS